MQNVDYHPVRVLDSRDGLVHQRYGGPNRIGASVNITGCGAYGNESGPGTTTDAPLTCPECVEKTLVVHARFVMDDLVHAVKYVDLRQSWGRFKCIRRFDAHDVRIVDDPIDCLDCLAEP